MENPSQRGDPDSGESSNEIEETLIKGDVVQARDVSGGVHFHSDRSDPQEPRAVPRQLPADISIFINRKPELRTLTRIAATGSRGVTDQSRRVPAAVVVITGSAGVGKTALALHWAHRIRDRFPDGEIYANLRGYDEIAPVGAEVALDRILRDLGVPPQQIPQELDRRAAMFRSLIAGRRVLIVLDNVANISQVRPIIPGGIGPFLIVTSRNQLPGLVIRDGAQRIQLDIFQESDAVALLRRVTRTGRRQDKPADLTELARLCARLPLALRIAAERAVSRPMMQLAELIADLRDDSMLWEALSVGDELHGEAVRTVFAWSYRDLSAEAADMFRALGLHRGPDVSLAAAAAAAGVPSRIARRALDILLGAFLLETVQPGRYRLHDLLRAYALDQARIIDSDSSRREVLDRIVRWYTLAASQACTLLSPGDRFTIDIPPVEGPDPAAFEDSGSALNWFDQERPNLIANAQSALAAGLYQRAFELSMVLSPIHMQHFTFDDWSAHSEIAVAAAEALADQTALASALDNRGKFLFRKRHLDDAMVFHSRALSLRESIGDRRGICESLNALGLISLRTRDLAGALEYFSNTTANARSIGDARWQGLAQSNLAEAHLESGDAAVALEIIEPLPALFVSLRDPASEGNALWLLSWAQRLLGRLPDALTAINSALAIAESSNNRAWEAFWLIEAARVNLAAGDGDEAMRCCRIAASLERQIGDPSREAAALDCVGEILRATGKESEAAAFHLQAARMHQELGDRWQEALAMIHLADCEVTIGQVDSSRQHLAHALSIIEFFPDNRAQGLSRDLAVRLA